MSQIPNKESMICKIIWIIKYTFLITDFIQCNSAQAQAENLSEKLKFCQNQDVLEDWVILLEFCAELK